MYVLLATSVVFSLFINIKINELSKEISIINLEIRELERTRASKNDEYIKKYSFENIENLSKLNSYIRLNVKKLNLDLETPYKLNMEKDSNPTIMGFGR
tara:strand:+ start:328 stop:624 length:297 start_codon:yes stop_codon:yes gene_type:complete